MSKQCNPDTDNAQGQNGFWPAFFARIRQNVRKDKLPYMLMFTLAPIFPGMKNSLMLNAHPLWGVNAIFIMGIGYSIGIGLLFAFARLERIAQYARWVALSMLAAFALWISLPKSTAATLVGLVFSLLLGGCGGFQLFGFSYALNDNERLMGASLTSLFCLSFQALLVLLPLGDFGGIIYVGLQVLVSALCLMRYKNEDVSHLCEKCRPAASKALALTLFFFISHRAITFFHSYLSHGANQIINGLAGLLVFFLSLSIYFLFEFNIWHMCNMFFAGLALSAILHLLLSDQQGGNVAKFLDGFSHMGFIASYFLLGHALGSNANLRLFKKTLALVFGASLLLHIIPGTLARLMPEAFPLINAMVAVGLFVIFTLLMPIMSRRLFIKVVVQETAEERWQRHIQAYDFTPREQEVVALLLKGMLYKQCAAQMHISQDTVKFHAKNAYRKAGVTTRNELMSLFNEHAPSTPEGQHDAIN